MTGNFTSLSVEDFNAIVKEPSLAVRLVELQIENPDESVRNVINEIQEQVRDPNLTSELKEHYKALLQQIQGDFAGDSKSSDDWSLGKGTKCLDIDKSWDALNALLMLNEPEDSPLGFILSGGQEIHTDDFGYGPPHGFTPEQTREIAEKLNDINSESLVTLANLKEFESHDLYCFSVDEDEVEYLRNYLDELKALVSEAARNNQALIVYLA